MRAFDKYHDIRSAIKSFGTAKVSERLKEELRSGQRNPQEFSIARLFEATVPHATEIMQAWRHGDTLSVTEADSLGTSDFALLTQNIVFAEMMNAMESEEYVFTGLIPSKPARHRLGETMPRVGGFGDDAEVVNERQEYPELSLTEDWVRTPPPVKRGGKISLTKEIITFDQTGLVLEQARAIGDTIAYNKEIRAIDCVVDENTTAHRYRYKDNAAIATYNDNSGTHTWDNLAASNGLADYTDLDAAEQLLNAILDPITGRPVLVSATDLVCCKQEEATANFVLNSMEVHVAVGGYATSGNPSMQIIQNPWKGRYQLRTSRLLASRMATDTSWYLGSISKAFAYMEVWPATVSQAPANSHDEFNRDIVTQYKVSEMGAYATVEPRYVVKSTA
jgi:hypothetical protein